MSAKSRLAIAAAAGVLILVAWGWWKHSENERQLRSIAEQIYEYAGYGDSLPDGGSYRRDRFGRETCDGFDDWVGAYGVGVGGTIERAGGAEPIAASLEASGWIVERWKSDGSGGGQVLDIFARRDRIRVDISFGVNDIRIGVFDGPCGALIDASLPADWTNPVQVQHFDP